MPTLPFAAHVPTTLSSVACGLNLIYFISPIWLIS
jgi:hypothetical protein